MEIAYALSLSQNEPAIEPAGAPALPQPVPPQPRAPGSGAGAGCARAQARGVAGAGRQAGADADGPWEARVRARAAEARARVTAEPDVQQVGAARAPSRWFWSGLFLLVLVWFVFAGFAIFSLQLPQPSQVRAVPVGSGAPPPPRAARSAP